jgi:hypothetical protein
MEVQTRIGKRDRDDTDDRKPAACSPLEESANALAGVEGALSSSNSNAKPPPNKRTRASKKNAAIKERSESIDQLISVAGSLLQDSTATAAAIAESNSTELTKQSSAASSSLYVPNPIVLQQESNTLTFANAAAPPSSTKSKSTKPTAKPPPIKKKAVDKKTQVQYNPDVPMTKEQLTSWRREMRRVRNRESAAASRRKVRDRIEELEEEVGVWKLRYEEAMRRLGEAQERKGEGGK